MEGKFERCKVIHRRFLDKPEYEAFRTPVKWKELGLLDYPKVVKQPMDLTTISNKLNKGTYCNPSEYIFDMRLIYHNCMLFNLETSELYETGKRFMEEFEKVVKEEKLYDYAFKYVPKKTEQLIQQFTYALQCADTRVVGATLNVLAVIAPECLSSNDDKSCDVDLTKMDGDTVEYLLEFLISLSN